MGDYRLDNKKYYDSKINYNNFWIILPFLWDYISYFWTCFDTIHTTGMSYMLSYYYVT